MENSRALFINRSHLFMAMQDKEYLDALAITVGLKAKFVSSKIFHFSTNLLVKLMGISKNKACDIKKKLLQYKLAEVIIEKDGSETLMLANIKGKMDRHKKPIKVYINKDKNNNISLQLKNINGVRKYTATKKNLRRIIEKLIVIAHLQICKSCSDCSRVMEEGTSKEKRHALKKIRGIQKATGKNLDLDSHKRGISYERMAKILDCSSKKVQKLINEMVEEDQIIKKFNKTDLHHAKCHSFDYSEKVEQTRSQNIASGKCGIRKIFEEAGKLSSQLYMKKMDDVKSYKKQNNLTRTFKDKSSIDKYGNFCIYTYSFYANEYELTL